MKTQRDEATLAVFMHKAKAGDKDSYKQFLTAVTPLIRGIIRGNAGGLGQDQQEDIVQDVLMAVHAKRHSWDSARPIRPWLFAITRYKVVDAFRQYGKAQHVDIDDYTETLVMADTDDDNQIDVRRCIARLKGKQRQIVEAIVLDGKSHDDVARELGMRANAVRVNFHRGVATLRKQNSGVARAGGRQL